MAQEKDVTVIGRSAVVRGEISGECDVQIDGSLEGSVHVSTARITVGPDARVRATLSAQEIVVLGQVEGELRAAGRVELRSPAVVIGNVFSARFAMESDAVLRGHVDAFDAAGPGAGTSTRDGSLPSAQRPVLFTEAGTASERNESTVAAAPGRLAHIPSGLAAAAATVSTSQRPTTPDAMQQPAMPQPSWAAEPKNS